MPDTPKHSVSVAGIVVDDQDRVLLIQRRDNGHWEPPGGVLELDETFEEGVKREVFEETGIHVEVERLTGVYKNMRRSIVALVFKCSPAGGRLTRTTESLNVTWTPMTQIPTIVAEAYAVRIMDAFSNNYSARVHDGRKVHDD